jgi:hypothetical protein
MAQKTGNVILAAERCGVFGFGNSGHKSRD